MRRILHLLGLILICSTIILLSGCSKKLSEEKAKGVISDYMDKAAENQTGSLGDLQIHTGYGYDSKPEDDKERPQYMEMEKRGLIKLSYVPPPEGNLVIRRIALTDMGRKYFLSMDTSNPYWPQTKVLLGVKKFNKIRGITEPSDGMGQKMCTVEYETRWELTPFGEILLGQNGAPPQVDSVQFVLYNDGWRLMTR